MYRYSTKQVSESFELGVLLAAVGGYLDAYTYLSRGHIFANAQTGNIVLLGIQLADGNFFKALTYLIPILAFAVGILVVEMVKTHLKSYKKLHWRQITVGAELPYPARTASFVPEAAPAHGGRCVDLLCLRHQVETFRKLSGDTFATTMCTGNLRSATEQLYRHLQSKSAQEKRRSIR